MIERRSNRPAAGGWVPSGRARAAGIVVVSVLGSVSPVLLSELANPWNVIAAAAGFGAATGIAAALGITSAGPRKFGKRAGDK